MSVAPSLDCSGDAPARDPRLAREVLRLRLSQLLINERYKARAFRIPIHLALGHEAIAVATGEIMTDSDRLVLPHRNLHYNLARCASLKPILDEFLLSSEGLAGGRQGSMNLANPERGIVYSSSILGNNLGVAAGVALAGKAQGRDGVTVVVTGDGAMEEGSFYETLLFLASQSLPAMVIVENNEWSLASRIEERRGPVCLDAFSAGLGADYACLSGNDVFGYASDLAGLRARAMSGRRPVVVEVRLQTLGDWRLKTDEYPEGKYINYHAGPAPTTELREWPVIADDTSDPVAVLANHFPPDRLKDMAAAMLSDLQGELA